MCRGYELTNIYILMLFFFYILFFIVSIIFRLLLSSFLFLSPFIHFVVFHSILVRQMKSYRFIEARRNLPLYYCYYYSYSLITRLKYLWQLSHQTFSRKNFNSAISFTFLFHSPTFIPHTYRATRTPANCSHSLTHSRITLKHSSCIRLPIYFT